MVVPASDSPTTFGMAKRVKRRYAVGNGPVRVGAIGYGGAFNMGKTHLTECRRGGMVPTAVCEPDEQRRAQAEVDFPGIATFASLDELLKADAADLLLNITPHDLHYPLARQCLMAGKHVVNEKPFVITTAEADKLIALAEKRKLLLSTYHNRHWDGWILRAIREIVEKQTIGRVHRIEAHMGSYQAPRDWWRSRKSVSGGILYDWGVHLLEYCFQILPGEMVEVSGFKAEGHWPSVAKKIDYRDDHVEDEAFAVIRFDDGALVNLSISHVRSDGLPDFLTFVGDRGSYGINWSGWTHRKTGRNGKIKETTGKHPKSQGHKFYANVARALAGEEDLIITPQWARRPIHAIDLAVRSAEQNKTLKTKYG
ncbi:MAG: Gfo/Idh/MocA family oxidoreductase [Planctomycetota bacterium]